MRERLKLLLAVIAAVMILAVTSMICSAGPYRGMIAAQLGVSSVKRFDVPDNPNPEPKVPRSECTECNGTGVVGDGTIEVPCGNCYDDSQSEEFVPPGIDLKEESLPTNSEPIIKHRRVCDGNGVCRSIPYDSRKFRISKGEWGKRRWLDADGSEQSQQVWVSPGQLLRIKKIDLTSPDTPPASETQNGTARSGAWNAPPARSGPAEFITRSFSNDRRNRSSGRTCFS
jgi:hypothetical protein